MPFFSYHAISRNGIKQKGRIEANSEIEAYHHLLEKGLQPIDCVEENSSFLNYFLCFFLHKKLGNLLPRLKKKELLLFTQEMADLLEAGLQIETALRIMEERQDNSSIKIISTYLRKSIREGVSFSNALKQCKQSLDEIYPHLVLAGEISGALPQILRKHAEHLNMMQEMKKKVNAALIYPMIVFSSAVILMFVFLTFLLPQLSSLLSKSGKQLPFLTECLLNISLFFENHWFLIAMGCLSILTLVLSFIKQPSGRAFWDQNKLKIPLLGNILQTEFFAETLQILSTLVSNNISLVNALELIAGGTANIFLKKMLNRIVTHLHEGDTFNHALKKQQFFPPILLDILNVGEKTGKMDMALLRAAERYDKELTKQITYATTLIQPAIILFVALFVGMIAYSMIAGILSGINSTFDSCKK